jgi:hypothetical protein
MKIALLFMLVAALMALSYYGGKPVQMPGSMPDRAV